MSGASSTRATRRVPATAKAVTARAGVLPASTGEAAADRLQRPGRAGARWYSPAPGVRVAFYPALDRLWLFAEGAKVRAEIQAALRRRQLPHRDVSHAPAAITHRALVEVILPTAPLARARAEASIMQLVTVELPRRGATARLTVPMFRARGVVEGLGSTAIVRFRAGTSPGARGRIASRYKLEIVRGLPALGAVVVQRAGLPRYELLDQLAEMALDPEVEHTEPDVVFFTASAHHEPGDFLWKEQPDLRMAALPEAWDQTRGSRKVTVAVVDLDGVDGDHPAFAGRVVGNWDFARDRAQQGPDLGGDHGTQCAATAVGAMDDDGTVGVAGACSLIGARLSTYPTVANIVDAWLWAAGFPVDRAGKPPKPNRLADVISNSWGVDWAQSQIMFDALHKLVTGGRGGQGCVVCFSTGNLGYEDFAARAAYAADARTIAVGATIAQAGPACDSDYPAPMAAATAMLSTGLPVVADTRAYYSPHGVLLDLVAPSHATDAGFQRNQPVAAATRRGEGNWIARSQHATTLTAAVTAAAATAGSSTVVVKNTAGFEPRGIALFERPGDATREMVKIQLVNARLGTLRVAPLRHGHLQNARVSTGPADYGDTFGGTSHATAMVAGAAALVLTLEPRLGWRQVRDLLCVTARQIDETPVYPDGQWVTDSGHAFSRWYGHGRLDVAAAVKMAVALAGGDPAAQALLAAMPAVTDKLRTTVEVAVPLAPPVVSGSTPSPVPPPPRVPPGPGTVGPRVTARARTRPR